MGVRGKVVPQKRIAYALVRCVLIRRRKSGRRD